MNEWRRRRKKNKERYVDKNVEKEKDIARVKEIVNERET